MNTENQFASRSLRLSLPPEIVVDSKISLHSPFEFTVEVNAENLTKCTLVISADGKIFKEDRLEIEVTFDSSPGNQLVAVLLTPFSRTVKPSWVRVEGKADTIIQEVGFFVTVV